MKETLNLLPGKEKMPRPKGIAFYLGIAVSAYLLIIASLTALNIITSKRLDLRLKAMEAQRTGLLSLIKPPSAEPPVITKEKEIADKLMSTPPLDMILGELSVVVPERVRLSLIDIKDSSGTVYMSIKGFSRSQVDTAAFISQIEASSYFSDVEIVFSQKTERDVTFELKVKIQWT